MTLVAVEAAWQATTDLGHKRYALIEMGRLPDEARLRLLQSAYLKRPLMHQQEFAALQAFGPWLLDAGDMAFDELPDLCDSAALMGWISSDCPLPRLVEHLGDSLLARDESGEVFLLRGYLPGILPLLHERTEADWHGWLFGPLHQWWLPVAGGNWQCLAGLGLDTPTDYYPIQLDEPLWHALELDPLLYSLTRQLERQAAEVFTSTCHGERLEQVRLALQAARDQGLQDRQDQSLFATLQLLDPGFPGNQPDWPLALRQALEQGVPLGQALRALPQ
ncbi:hypothetical protein FQZ97_895630 [compost metagenome]